MIRKLKICFNSFVMFILFGEKCTCGENDGCYICSPHFKLISTIFDKIWRY